MAIIRNVNLNQFIDAFREAGREGSFTYDGFKALFEYLGMLSDETETPMELDVIALCCEYSEYNEDELTNDYGVDNTFDNLSDEIEERIVARTDDTIILHS